MTNELWINLPVKDIKRSVEFFTAIGFSFKNDSPGSSPVSAAMSVGTKNVIVMLFQNDAFKSASQHEIADTNKGTEALFSFDIDTREGVDELTQKVTAAGGTVFAPPAVIQGWMYGCGFIDPDGHRWNALNMDMSKMK